MWLDMRVSVLCLMVMLILAPVLAAYDYCKDLPNVYTVEDLRAIEEKCKDAPVLASKIYPSATWIIHGHLSVDGYLYADWLGVEQKPKVLHKICIIWLGGEGSAAASSKYTSVSGNCGGSYPIDYADEFNFIDFTAYASTTVTPSFNHSLIQDRVPVPNTDHYILLVQVDRGTRNNYFGYQKSTSYRVNGADERNKYVALEFSNNDKAAGSTIKCPAYGIKSAYLLAKCSSIIGPLVYNSSFYGMEELDISRRPYHHGCFIVENNNLIKDLDFLDKLKTGSDYVDRCIGKFANVVRNNPNLCPDPKRYYASMDPDPESLIRKAFLNSKWNKQGVPEVKVEFPKGMTYECVNECSDTIDDKNATVNPVGQFGFPCKIFTGDITLMNDTLKKVPQPNSARILEHIREIKGRLTVNAEVDSDVLPQLRIVGGSRVRAPALVLTITDKNIYEAVLPMRLSSVTADPTTGVPVLLKHSMPHDEIPKTLKNDLERSAGGKDRIKYEKIELHSHKRNHFV